MNAQVPELSIPDHVPTDRIVDFDISSDPDLRVDVFKRIEQVRDAAPRIAYTPRNGGHWMVFDRSLIEQVLADGVTFSSAHLGQGNGPGMIPLGIDPPAHAPWRALLLKHFGPTVIRKLEPFVREWAEKLVRKLDHATTCDFLKEVGEPMPVSVFMEIMGLPLERFEEFRSLATRALTPPEDGAEMITVNGQTVSAETMAVHGQIAQVLAELIAERKREPRDDLVSKLLADTFKGRPITDAELMSMSYLLFLAGLDTVTNAMTYGMRHLAQDTEMQDQVRRDRSTIPAVIEQLMRRYTFVNTHRVVTRETELDGVVIKPGDMVWCVLWSGSNDPQGEQEGPRHLAFGWGHHQCLGMYLARLELRVMYETWFDHIDRFTLAADDRPAMRGGSVMNITRLLLNLEPKGESERAAA